MATIGREAFGRRVRVERLFRFLCADIGSGLQAIHERHLNVHQNHVELVGLMGLPKAGAFFAVVGQGHTVAKLLQ